MTSPNASNAPRWSRLGLGEDRGPAYVQDLRGDLEHEGLYVDRVDPAKTPGARYSDDGRRDDLFAYLQILQLEHLQLPNPLRPAEETLNMMSQLAVDYFYGAWRDNAWCDAGEGMTREQCREELYWMDPLRYGLLAATLARRTENLEKLCEYADDDLQYDEGFWDRTKEDNVSFIVFSQFVRRHNLDDCRGAAALAKSRRKRPKLFMAAVNAIAAEDPQQFRAAMDAYVKQYVKVELDLDVRIVVCVDASMLWAYGEANLGAIEPLDLQLMDHIMTRESLGLA